MPCHSIQPLLVGLLACSNAEIPQAPYRLLVYSSTRGTGSYDLLKKSRRATTADPQETIAAVARGGFWGRSQEDDEEWEYYSENEGEGDVEELSEELYEYEEDRYGKIQDIDSEFLSDSGDDDSVGEEESTADNEAFEQVNESLLTEKTTIIEQAETDSDDTGDDGFLLSTPIPTKNEEENKSSSPRNFFFAPRKTTASTKPESEPLPNAPKKQNRFTTSQDVKKKNERRKTNSKINPSSSGASFISPVVYKLSSMVQDVSSASINARKGSGRNVFPQCINSLSKVTSSILQPFYLLFSTTINIVSSIVSKWSSIVMALIRRLVDTIWYGSVDGVTTTGISRSAGLTTVLKSPYLMIASSIFIIGIVTLSIRQQTREMGSDCRNNSFANAFRFLRRRKVDGILDQIDGEDDYDSDDSIDPPSAEDELEFLGSFNAANPTSRERISKTIAGGRSCRWRFKSQSSLKQRQRSIKSIQKWWKQRPSTSVTIIEPQHVQNQQPLPSSQRISQLQSQLAQSEQERAVLQLDIQRLQQRLQKAHHDARAIVAKNEWLEKQQSKADKILAKAIEVERRKANSDMEKVRDTMKGVLERERMLMRGRLADNLTSRRLREEDTVRNTTYMESTTGMVDQGRSNNEEESDSDELDDKDSIWGKRPSTVLGSSAVNYGGAATIMGGR